jgi:iron(III) transport system ATP-binding protein
MIALYEVSKRFGTTHALENISLEISTGEIIILQGPSGSGKTTLLRLLAGLERPDHGEIWLDGARTSCPGWAAPPFSRGIGMVFQRSVLWPHLTVSQNILFAMDGTSLKEKRSHLAALLSQTELADKARRYPAQLSGGEARRVALARALAAAPRRLLLDEPLTNLDPDLKARMLELIISTTRENRSTLVYVTHSEEETKSITGRCIGLNRGRLVP